MGKRNLGLRSYRTKNSELKFLCPLCGNERGIRYRANPRAKHYFQILFTSAGVTALLYPLIHERALGSLLVIWIIFEIIYKLNFRKDVVCPHCGFDPIWYKRDVKVARRLVKEFFSNEKDMRPNEKNSNGSVQQAS